MHGYGAMIQLGIKAPADMLETVAGYPDEHRTKRELAFAFHATDENDPDSLRWLACLVERRLNEIERR